MGKPIQPIPIQPILGLSAMTASPPNGVGAGRECAAISRPLRYHSRHGPATSRRPALRTLLSRRIPKRHAEHRDALAHLRIREGGQEALHRRAVAMALDDEEIIML